MHKISIIIPFLNEEENLPTLHSRLQAVADQLAPSDVEVVLVDDGSTDRSAEITRGLRTARFSTKLVRLSRNFGSYAAIPAGIGAATGDALTFLSADLQDPPELIAKMAELWRNGNRVVFATRESREDPLIGRVFASLFYRAMRRFALPNLPAGGTDVCFVDRKVVEALGGLQERNSNLFYLLVWAGFHPVVITYHREERRAGRSKWTLSKKLKLFIDSFVAFSFVPLRLISLTGLGLAGLGFTYGAALLTSWAFGADRPTGWMSMMLVVLVLVGAQMVMLGIIAEYLWRTLDVARTRPLYIVDTVEEIPPSAAES